MTITAFPQAQSRNWGALGGAPSLAELIRAIARDGVVTDLLLTSDNGLSLQAGGRRSRVPEVEPRACERWITGFVDSLGEAQRSQYDEAGHVTVPMTGVAGQTIRVNLYRCSGMARASVRLLAEEVPAFDQLGYPPAVRELAFRHSGFIPICGPVNAGKTTLLAALVREIDQAAERLGGAHIFVVEDPTEYHHHPVNVDISAIAVGPRQDFETFEAAVRCALRSNVNVVVIGEMFTDDGTVGAALDAADAGMLVLGTIHARTVSEALGRIIASFPPERDRRMRQLLGSVFAGGVCTRLVPAKNMPGVLPACEIVNNADPIPSLIERGELDAMKNYVGVTSGTQTLDQHLQRLVLDERISRDEARLHALHPDQLK